MRDPKLQLLLPIIVLFPFFSSLPDQVDGQPPRFPQPLCSSLNGTFPAGSAYASSLDSLLASISTVPSMALKYGFFNRSTGHLGSDYAEVLGLCHADLTADDCRTCLVTSGKKIRQNCPGKTLAVLYKENCTIRYSNESIYGTMMVNPIYPLSGNKNVMNPSKHDQVALDLLNNLRVQAASRGPLRKYSTGQAPVGSKTIFGMVQCTPDLSNQQCTDCLKQIIAMMPRYCAGKIGGRIFAPSCQFRFKTNFRFYGPIPTYSASPPMVQQPPTGEAASPPPPGEAAPPPPPPPPEKKDMKWIVICTSVASAILIISVFLFLIKKRMKPQRQRLPIMDEETDEIATAESLQFDLVVIRDATDNFSNANKLGEGGFGAVFRGKLPNGQGIAVKRLSTESRQGEREFKNEVVLLARLQHRNLVRLLGFCLGRGERLLIYELVPNSSLNNFIFDPLKRARLDWDSRYKIITGVVRGLVYLHEDSRLRIIHRDLKAGNILLDADMNPKISDFGMARLFELDQTHADTRRIVGTYGYMAPEYAMNGHFSVKSDVFSFGVLVLEIVSGHRSLDLLSGSETLLNYVWKNWRDEMVTNIVDPLMSLYPLEEVLRCIHIGLLCVQENVNSRPTMTSVAVMLSSHSVTLPAPSQPAFVVNTGTEPNMSSGQDTATGSSNPSSNPRSTSSLNEASMTDPYPR